jgi:hypothetical protein
VTGDPSVSGPGRVKASGGRKEGRHLTNHVSPRTICRQRSPRPRSRRAHLRQHRTDRSAELLRRPPAAIGRPTTTTIRRTRARRWRLAIDDENETDDDQLTTTTAAALETELVDAAASFLRWKGFFRCTLFFQCFCFAMCDYGFIHGSCSFFLFFCLFHFSSTGWTPRQPRPCRSTPARERGSGMFCQ